MTPELKIRTLELLESHKLCEVLGDPPDTRLEASGICTAGDAYYVIFDNRPDIARITKSTGLMGPGNGWLHECGADSGHEDICFDERTGHFFVLIEAMRDKHGDWASVVDEYDGDFNLLERRFVDFRLQTENKGFEGIAYVYRRDPDGGRGEEGFLVLLCEGNLCKAGKAGRTPGGGRVHVFRKGKKRWKLAKQIDLPPWLPFEDYSGIEVLGDHIAITSQASAMAWVARVIPGETVTFDEGALFEFPRDEQGNVIFCNVEGVTWGSKELLVTVSDRMKQDQDERCGQCDQSIQVFRIPPEEIGGAAAGA